jgi:hypothetical protein
MKKMILAIAIVSMFATMSLAGEECTSSKVNCETTCETPLNCAVHEAQDFYKNTNALLVQGSLEANSLSLSYHELDAFYVTVGNKTQEDNLFMYGFGKSHQLDESLSVFVGAVFGTYESDEFVGGVDVGILIHAHSDVAVSMSYNRLSEYSMGLGILW